MSEPDHPDVMPPEETRALFAEAERRFETLLDKFPAALRQEIDDGKISRHEASTLVLDCLLTDAAVWQRIEKLVARPKLKRTPKLAGKADNARQLAAAFNVYAGIPPHAGKSIGSLVRKFRKTLGAEFSWIRGMSHERVEDLIREGRLHLVPDLEELLDARRASLAHGSRPWSPAQKTAQSEPLPDDISRAPPDEQQPLALPGAPGLNLKESSFLRLIGRGK